MSASIVYVVMSLTRAAFIDQVETILKTGLAVTDVDDVESDSDMRQEIIDTQQKILIARNELLKLVVGVQRASGGGTIDVEKALPNLKLLSDVDLEMSSFEVYTEMSSSDLGVSRRRSRLRRSRLIAGTKLMINVSLCSKTGRSFILDPLLQSSAFDHLPVKVVVSHADWGNSSYAYRMMDHTAGGSVGQGFEYMLPEMASHLKIMTARVHVTFCGQQILRGPMKLVVHNQVSERKKRLLPRFVELLGKHQAAVRKRTFYILKGHVERLHEERVRQKKKKEDEERNFYRQWRQMEKKEDEAWDYGQLFQGYRHRR